MFKKETITSLKKVYDNYFDTDIEINKVEGMAKELLIYMSDITRPVPVSDEKKFKSYSLKSREDVLNNINNI